MQPIENVIDLLLKNVEEISTGLKKLKETDHLSDNKNFENLCDELYFLSERHTSNFRQFIQNTYVKNRNEVMSNSCDISGIDVCKKDGKVFITLPCLLPRKKGNEHKFIGEPLRYKLEELSKNVNLKIREKAVVCIIHTYDNANKKARCYDYDNLETKKFLDIITLYTLIDDAPQFCDVYHTIRFSDQDKTTIIVMPISSFDGKIVPYN